VCPACLPLAYLSERPPDLQALTSDNDTRTGQAAETGDGLSRPHSATVS